MSRHAQEYNFHGIDLCGMSERLVNVLPRNSTNMTYQECVKRLHVFHRHTLRLEDELIRIWWF